MFGLLFIIFLSISYAFTDLESSPAELPALFAFDPEEDLVLLAGDGFPSRLGLSLDEVLLFVRTVPPYELDLESPVSVFEFKKLIKASSKLTPNLLEFLSVLLVPLDGFFDPPSSPDKSGRRIQ